MNQAKFFATLTLFFTLMMGFSMLSLSLGATLFFMLATATNAWVTGASLNRYCTETAKVN